MTASMDSSQALSKNTDGFELDGEIENEAERPAHAASPESDASQPGAPALDPAYGRPGASDFSDAEFTAAEFAAVAAGPDFSATDPGQDQKNAADFNDAAAFAFDAYDGQSGKNGGDETAPAAADAPVPTAADAQAPAQDEDLFAAFALHEAAAMEGARPAGALGDDEALGALDLPDNDFPANDYAANESPSLYDPVLDFPGHAIDGPQSFEDALAQSLPAPPDGLAQPGDIGALADAVQEALRSIYGPDAAVEAGQPFGAEEPARLELLSGAPAHTPAQDIYEAPDAAAEEWNAAGEDFAPQARYSAELDDSTTEAVLSYLYSQGEAAANRAAAPAMHALEELREAVERSQIDALYQDPWPSGVAPEQEEPSDTAAYDAPPPYEARQEQEAPYYRGGALRAPYQKPAGEHAFKPLEQSARGGASGTRPLALKAEAETKPAGPLALQAQQTAAQQDRDSGRLLGAAGLGLIGGIALAGVLSVFLFNSFVTEPASVSGPSSAAPWASAPEPSAEPGAGSKIVARLEEVAPAAPGPDGFNVSDVFGQPPSPIALNIAVDDKFNNDSVLVSVRGLPGDARLSAGIDVGGGNWLLPPSRLAGLQLNVPAASAPSLTLEAQLLQTDARTPVTGAKSFTVSLQPGSGSGSISTDAVQRALAAMQGQDAKPSEPPAASATPPVRGAAIPEAFKPSGEALRGQQFIREGNRAMREGDILNARKLYEQAAGLGDPDASLAMGRSYDPSYFEQLQVKTGKPDPAQAFEWYMKALDGGVESAKVKIDSLKQWLLR